MTNSILTNFYLEKDRVQVAASVGSTLLTTNMLCLLHECSGVAAI